MKCPEITQIIATLSKERCDLPELRRKIGTSKRKLESFGDTKSKILAFDILYSYTYIFMDQDRGLLKYKIIQTMFEIIEELKSLQKKCSVNIRNSSSAGPMISSMHMKQVPPEFYILSKIAEKFISVKVLR